MLRNPVEIQERLHAFFDDETGGERDIVTTLLILGAIIVPIVLALVALGINVQEAAQSAIESVLSKFGG